MKHEKNIQTQVGPIERITFNRHGMEVTLISYGAAVYSIKINGKEVSVRPEELNDFLTSDFDYGKTIGRTAGRLICPSYEIDGIHYPVKPYRSDKTKLHGGATGFCFRHFQVIDIKENDDISSATFRYVSLDGEEDYPGELTLDVIYTLDNDMNFRIDYRATTTKDTLCSITNHLYFNLAGYGDIMDHDLQVDASKYIEGDNDGIPLGKFDVTKTAFDLRKLVNLGSRIRSIMDTPAMGYDHPWLFDKKMGYAKLVDPTKTLSLELTTDYPAVVIFTHNLVSPSTLPAAYGDGVYSSLTLECEYEPGGIHFKDFNSAILRKEDTYKHFINIKFNVHKKAK